MTDVVTNPTTKTDSGDAVWAEIAQRVNPFVQTTASVDESKVREIVDETVRDIVPDRIEFTTNIGEPVKIERAHKVLREITSTVQAGFENLLLVGPAGTGKTTLASQFAQAITRQFGMLSLSAGVSETHILGRILPQGDGTFGHQSTEFLRIYQEGGIFLFDEVDGADANVLVILNSALANGKLVNPVTGEVHKRHEDCIIICAANTYGTGADAMYVGRNQLDAATLDRFVGAVLDVNYDTALERAIARSILPVEDAEEVIEFVKAVRKAIKGNRLRRVASTRMVEASCKHVAAGMTMKDVKSRMLSGWSKNDIAKIEEGC